MTKQEIQELMRVRADKKAEQYAVENRGYEVFTPDDKPLAEFMKKPWTEGHASATDTLAECLSLALEALEYYEEHYYPNDRAKETIAAIESKLKGGDK